jgi:NADP-dependent 3-hydroxy acid dehydrogenase YdfG
MLARSADRLAELAATTSGSRAYPTDVTDGGAVRDTFAKIRSDLGPIKVLLHNAGNAVFGDFMTISAEDFENSWRTNTMALLVCGQAAAPDMIAGGEGAIVVTGATASLRGGANFSGFASAKAAQRILAQSMARTLGPQGVHVAYVIVDGVIDMPATRAMMPDRPDDAFLKPDDIADSVFHVAHQPASAWTFELDVRPFTENW